MFLVIALYLCISASATGESFPGPCREWLWPCESGEWRCTSEETYGRFNLGTQPGCPTLPITVPPSGKCRLVNGICQYTNSSLECATWVPSGDFHYICGSVEERDQALESKGSSIGNPPVPDQLCLPINGTCQWYNPCRFWKGFCSSPYRCGSIDDYLAFQFGPQPLCAAPPIGWVPPIPPGECIITDQQCRWSDCTGFLDWCNTYWMCGSQYEQDVYHASPPPPCPPPPPGHTPPPQPGVCLFNISAGRCQYHKVSSTNIGTIVGVSVGLFVGFGLLIMLLMVVFCCVYRTRIQKKTSPTRPTPKESKPVILKENVYSELISEDSVSESSDQSLIKLPEMEKEDLSLHFGENQQNLKEKE